MDTTSLITTITIIVLILGAGGLAARTLLTYSLRSLWTRRMTTILTISGIALVAFVFAAVLMLANGLEKALVQTGSADNAIILRKAAQAELQSQIDREAASIIVTQPEVMLTTEGKPFAATELYVLISLDKVTGEVSNVTVRGVGKESIALRPQVKLIEGRMFTPGTREIVVGRNAEERFKGCQIGGILKFGNASWTVVGVMDANGSAFDTEIWADVEQLMPSFGRPVFSSVTVKLRSASEFETFKMRIENDRRTNFLEVKTEPGYYLEQSEMMATFIRILGILVTVIFSIGAIIGAMITMYAAVANRTVEIGTLRALGFKRRSILAAFMVESLAIALIGAVIGLGASSFLQLFVISTLNFGTFSELAFSFDMTTGVILSTVIFAMAMGFFGGLLPAARAARLRIVNALRSA